MFFSRRYLNLRHRALYLEPNRVHLTRRCCEPVAQAKQHTSQIRSMTRSSHTASSPSSFVSEILKPLRDFFWHGRSSEQGPHKQRCPRGHWESFEGVIWDGLGDRNPSRSRDSVGAGPVGPTMADDYHQLRSLPLSDQEE